jgi:hypothetical protein
MTSIYIGRRVRRLIMLGLAVAGVCFAVMLAETPHGAGANPPTNGQKSALLVTASPIGAVPNAIHADATSAALKAAEILDDIPLPPGPVVAGSLDWSQQGDVSDADIQFLLQFRASCDWLRYADRGSGLSDEDLRVLHDIPNWSAFRSTRLQARFAEIIGAFDKGDSSLMRHWLDINCRPRARG